MIKKGIFIAASLMIVGCGAKNNSNNNGNNTQDVKPPTIINVDNPKTDPKPEPIKPDPTPDIKPDPTPDPVISEALNMLSGDEINYKISTSKKAIYSDCTKPITERDVTVHCTINNGFGSIDGDFYINIKKELPNKLIFSYIGKAIINKNSQEKYQANIDCTNKTVQEVTFHEKGITPLKIELLVDGCKADGLAMVPLINTYSWLNSNVFLKGIYTDDGTSNISPFRRPDRSQVIYFENY